MRRLISAATLLAALADEPPPPPTTRLFYSRTGSSSRSEPATNTITTYRVSPGGMLPRSDPMHLTALFKGRRLPTC